MLIMSSAASSCSRCCCSNTLSRLCSRVDELEGERREGKGGGGGGRGERREEGGERGERREEGGERGEGGRGERGEGGRKGGRYHSFMWFPIIFHNGTTHFLCLRLPAPSSLASVNWRRRRRRGLILLF